MPLGRALVIAALCVFALPRVLAAQSQPATEYIQITADSAFTWSEDETNVVLVQGPVKVQLDRATLTADKAVLWLTPLPGTVLDQVKAEISLIGNAQIDQGQVSRSGDTLFVTTQVHGAVRITAEHRLPQDLSDSELYKQASAMRPEQVVRRIPGGPPNPALKNLPPTTPPPPSLPEQVTSALTPSAAASTQPAVPRAGAGQPVSFRAGIVESTQTPDNHVAVILSSGVTLFQARPNGDFIELQADRVVLFTNLESLTDITNPERLHQIEDAVNAAYLEGDVRISFTPHSKRMSEQRLRATRVYYEFATDRAVLTDAVIHTLEPQQQIPIIVRANTVRQLSIGEYRAEGVELSTSSFATPSYSIHADKAYVRQTDTGDPRLGQRTFFSSWGNTSKAFGIPFFYWPWASGSITDRGFPLRELAFGSASGFGPSIRTRWGLFESIGVAPPNDLDISYRLDYYGDRGPGGGIDADYGGGFITETTKQPWNFQGAFRSYAVLDNGNDRLGRDRARVTPEDEFRYRILWEHQHFFPNDWQIQLRAGAVSDPTFLEEWFNNEFNNGLPHDVSAYIKRQRDTEALTLLVQFQPNDLVTTSDLLQEGFEVERLPELGYYRTGDSLFDDQFTFFSANTVSGLHFNESRATLADLGFRHGETPGLPSLGTTGVTDDVVWRGDFRQEIDYPFSAGQFRVVPYAFGRYTPYSDTPAGGDEQRVFVGTGLRVTTAFWKVDNTAQNELLDIHRLRHVVEPELNLFTSCSTSERGDVFVYDEPVDAINDVSAVQLALRQRWQTKRGGAGQWRNVDFFSFNVEGNFYANQPDESDREPTMFRGLFFPSLPEASIPRNSINADSLWRVSDTTAVLYDIQYNLDDMELATTSIGVAAQRGDRLSYFLGTRYIGEINSTIASLAANYELTAKYTVRFTQSFNLGDRRNQDSNVTIIRKFDRFFLSLTMFYDAVDDTSGFRFGVYPEGLNYGLSSDQFQRAFGAQ